MALTKTPSTSTGMMKWIHFESTSVITVINALSTEGMNSGNVVYFNTTSGTTTAVGCRQ